MDRVTMTEAARQLGANKSTISRWVKKHPALKDEKGRVCVEELRAHRDTVINPALQTRAPADPEAKAKPGRSAAKPKAIASEEKSASTDINTHRARAEEAKAVTAELDLADRLELTMRRKDVEIAAADAGAVMKRVTAQMVKDRAEALARIDDPRAMEVALDEMMAELMGKIAKALREAVGPEDDAAHAA
ncbi:hypothetical protein FHY55_19410 [Oceanicola sp. D3]|uniref:hypothetical protein n=1 Tax=Oceanicola sp. D3 TaxID=2587163 RepID=UPI00111D8E5D|nr:hypothetical protein [Oceanicola sp. D3]QDC11267.1 hypothetical protein FHY55_19410 [Oceanicola sp. D3]